MNVVATNGLVGRYTTDWARAGGIVKNTAIKIEIPTCPGTP